MDMFAMSLGYAVIMVGVFIGGVFLYDWLLRRYEHIPPALDYKSKFTRVYMTVEVWRFGSLNFCIFRYYREGEKKPYHTRRGTQRLLKRISDSGNYERGTINSLGRKIRHDKGLEPWGRAYDPALDGE